MAEVPVRKATLAGLLQGVGTQPCNKETQRQFLHRSPMAVPHCAAVIRTVLLAGKTGAGQVAEALWQGSAL